VTHVQEIDERGNYHRHVVYTGGTTDSSFRIDLTVAGNFTRSRDDAEVQTETMTVTREAWVQHGGVFQFFNSGTFTYTDSAWMNDVNSLSVFGSPDGAVWGFDGAAMHLGDTDWSVVSWYDEAALTSSGEVTVDQVVSSFTSAEDYTVDWTTTHDDSETTEDGTRVDSFTTTGYQDASAHYTVESDDEGNYWADDLWTRHLSHSQTDTYTRYTDERATTVASIGSQTWSGVDNSSLYLYTSWGDATDTTSPTLDAGDITIDQSRTGTYSGSEHWDLTGSNGMIRSGTYSSHDHSSGTIGKDWFDLNVSYRKPEQPMDILPAQPAVQGTAYLKSHVNNATYTDDSTLNATYGDGVLQAGTFDYESGGSQGYENASG
jgi:hypothetical protein